MQFTVEKSTLLEKLIPGMGTVSSKHTIPSIEGVLIETMPGGKVRLSTYDMNKGYRALFTPNSIEREGKYIINAQRFLQTVRVMPEGEITIDVSETLNCTVSGGSSSFSMFAMPGKDFPNLPDLESEKYFTVSAKTLKKMISKVMHSVADQDPRPMLCGAFFKVEGGKLEVVSCDSYTLSVATYTNDSISIHSDNSTTLSFIMPGHALQELIRILPDTEDNDVKVYISRKHAIVNMGEVVFFTRTIESEYLDYTRLIPKDMTIFVELERERLLEGLERANIIADEKIQGSGKSYLTIELNRKYLTLSSVSANGKVYDEMLCTHEGEDIKIGFNCRYLINSVKASEGDTLKMCMKGATQAVTIESLEKNDDYNYFYMVVPIRMNGQ